jgi:hypothetical protein
MKDLYQHFAAWGVANGTRCVPFPVCEQSSPGILPVPMKEGPAILCAFSPLEKTAGGTPALLNHGASEQVLGGN